MQADQVFTDVSVFAVALRDLHAQRRGRVVSGRSERTPRAVLAKADRGGSGANYASMRICKFTTL